MPPTKGGQNKNRLHSMTTIEQQSNNINSSAVFDQNKVLKNYAAGMTMPGIYWPSAATFDNSMYAAYSQASALAAAAVANGVGSQISSNPQAGSSGPASSGSSSTPPFSTMVSSTTPALSTSISLPAHSTTPSTPKKKPEPVPDHMKDKNYWERRRRNNESARRSRESRRMKEEQIALRVVYLEQENLQLRTEASMLRSEIEKLRMILYNAHH
uniref:BZIP domain-containing protein n=1 Tax=Trichuris muris TaxID=70415 RepID=A0A5S6QV58_TRIMR